MRALLFLHRYLAVAVGLLMALWCLSGFVMMYQSFPELTQQERLAGLEPLRFTDCCGAQSLAAEELAGDFRIEMLDGRPVLRLRDDTIDLASGSALPALDREALTRIAATHAAQRGLGGTPRWLGEVVDVDQWSIQSARRNAPAHRFALDDDAGTELYLNGRTGEVFQDTNRRERVLSWLGAIPHWLYPTLLRANGALWTQVVIWTSVVGSFLAATGLYVGIARLRRNRGRLASPFRGWWYWHHIAGLVFGVLALTWVFSGLTTMNPWGWLESGEEAGRVRAELVGRAPEGSLGSVLQALPSIGHEDWRELRRVSFGGSTRVVARRADGSTLLLDAGLQPAPLTEGEVRTALARLDLPLQSFTLLDEEDAYHYGHKSRAPLPVWRAVLGDAGQFRVYVNPAEAGIRVVDPARARARWITQGLHSLDFPGLRWRPVWDIVALLLLAGTTVLCITGSWMAIQRVRRDLGGRRAGQT